MRRKKNRGINALKAKYGWICISPWIVGLILFCNSIRIFPDRTEDEEAL